MDKNNDSGLTRKFDATQPDAQSPVKKAPVRKKKPGTRRVFSIVLNCILTLILIGVLTGIIVGATFIKYINDHLVEDYDIVGLKMNIDQTTMIYYENENGELVELEDQRLYGAENRSWIAVNKMPDNLTNAFIAIEDQRFREHNGMDFKRTAGAVLEFLKGNKSYGGSTITQQLIKNFSGEDDVTLQRKIKEIFRAISLTKKRSKDEVLEMYLNTINLSNNCYGVQAASNYLFGKDASELTLVECAALASIPKSPYGYDPVRHPIENKERRELVLDKMYELGWITKEECDEAKATELELNITTGKKSESGTSTIYSYFTDALIEQIIADLNTEYGYPREVATNMIFGGGLKIYSTVDPDIQSIMEEVFEDPDSFPKVDGVQPQSAMVVMDPYTGDVKGIVGGRGEKVDSRGLNRATMSKRQIGSSIKPLLVYSPAVDLGYVNYATVVDDTPFKINEQTGNYWPSNAPARYDGLININTAIIKSKNTVAVKLIDMITPEYAYNFAQEKLGITSLVQSDMDYAPMALGGLTNGLTVMEVTAAYSIFANEGVYSAPRLYTEVYDNEGNLLLSCPERHNVAISRSTAQVMTKMMQNVLGPSGTGGRITLDNQIDAAGKTGSTNDDKDRYFAGFTPYYVGACWFGYDTPKYLGSKFDPNPAMMAWEKVMTRIHEDMISESKSGGEPLREFDESQLEKAEYCMDSGMLATELCRSFDPRGSRVEQGWFKKGTVPTEECNKHVIVKYDRETSSIANAGCNPENVGDVALVLEESRLFLRDIVITDAQYTYRPVPDDYIYPEAENTSFYANVMKENTYVGHTNVAQHFNRACTLHAGTVFEEELPSEDENPEDDTPEDENPIGGGEPDDGEEPETGDTPADDGENTDNKDENADITEDEENKDSEVNSDPEEDKDEETSDTGSNTPQE